jgi:hypothetical protein
MRSFPVIALAFVALVAWTTGWNAHGAKRAASQAGYQTLCGLQAGSSGNGDGGAPLQRPNECCAGCAPAALPLQPAPVSFVAETLARPSDFAEVVAAASRVRSAHAPRAPPLPA